jgi:hypothetical protein
MKEINDLKATKSYEQITENLQAYDSIIEALQKQRELNTPINEGIFSAIFGGIAGVTFGPAIMKSLCKVLGVNEKGSFGSLLTSRLVLGALATEIGWKA